MTADNNIDVVEKVVLKAKDCLRRNKVDFCESVEPLFCLVAVKIVALRKHLLKQLLKGLLRPDTCFQLVTLAERIIDCAGQPKEACWTNGFHA